MADLLRWWIDIATLTPQQIDEIIPMYGKVPCVEIAKMYGVNNGIIYDLRRRLKLTTKQNPVFEISSLQNQILLGGKLGDGNFKPNGLHNYYYRENHAEDELEYLKWKMNELGEMINKQGLYKIKKAGYNVQQPYGFSTITSPSFIRYAKMSIKETISEIDLRGLIIFMLDDGWFSDHSKVGNFCITGGILNREELEMVCNKFSEYGIKDVHIVGKKRTDLTIPSCNNDRLYEAATSFIPKDIDIIKKKFKTYNTKNL